MTDQSNVRAYAPPKERKVEEGLSSLATILGRHVDNTNSMTPVQSIATALKSLTYEEAQEIGAGLAQEIDKNKDKESGFDFSTSPIKLAPILTHLVQMWASTVSKAKE
jgi:hypothetical protein